MPEEWAFILKMASSSYRFFRQENLRGTLDAGFITSAKPEWPIHFV
jgi:hypothetical protein